MSRKTRAVIMPTIGDPYRAGLFLSAYRKCIKNEVDKLYVFLNSPADEAVVNYTKEMYEREGAEVIVSYGHQHQTILLTTLLEICKEDTVLILEDDFYITQPGHVDRWFSMIESGQVDAVGSPRGCTSAEMMNRTSKVFNLDPSLNQRTNFWPALYVGRTEDLLRIREKEYGPYTHPVDTYIPELDITTTQVETWDVFAWVSVQLRALGLKFHIEDQNNWIDVWITKRQPVHWIHTGAGSSSFLGHLITPDGKSIGQRDALPNTSELAIIQGDSMLWITETKQAVWEMILDHFPIPADSPAAYFNDVYASALQHSRNVVVTTDGKNMRDSSIQEMRNFYETILAPVLI